MSTQTVLFRSRPSQYGVNLGIVLRLALAAGFCDCTRLSFFRQVFFLVLHRKLDVLCNGLVGSVCLTTCFLERSDDKPLVRVKHRPYRTSRRVVVHSFEQQTHRPLR